MTIRQIKNNKAKRETIAMYILAEMLLTLSLMMIKIGFIIESTILVIDFAFLLMLKERLKSYFSWIFL